MKAVVLMIALFFSSVAMAQELPYSKEIRDIIDAVEYSGFQVFVKPEVSLDINFSKREWTLKNIHQFDAQGQFVLEQNRYGLCGELAAYVYQKLQPILDPRYILQFAMATESGFFPTTQSNHIVLLMLDQQDKDAYLIDPSFHKYGKINDLKEYQIINVQEVLSFVKDKTTDASFMANQAMPLFIRNDLLLTFSVITVDETLDKDNYLFVIYASHRDKYPKADLLIMGKYKGRLQFYVDTEMLENLLNEGEANQLVNKFKGWIKQLES